MDWKDYEEVTKYIYEQLGRDKGVEIECFGNSCKVVGKSTVNHQIDVLASHNDGIHTYKTAIECKYWDKTVNKDVIMKVSEIVNDANLTKGVIVSKLGFTPDAVSFAKHKNIGLVELREIVDDDWTGRIKNIKIDLHALLPQITDFQLLIEKETPNMIKPGTFEIDLLDVKFPEGNIENLRKWIDDFTIEVSKQNEGERFEKVYPFEKGTVITNSQTGDTGEITGLKFGGYLKISKDVIEIKGEDHVYMIMKFLFEEKSYALYRNGLIKER